ncbi:MAG: TetR/AcrR family transcriptional regulator [Bacteroidales bacterium]
MDKNHDMEDKVRKILTASEELFDHFGFSKSTSEEIAKKAGVSKRTLYKYFDSKKKILEVFIIQKIETLRHELDRILAKHIIFPEKMRQITTQVAVTLSGMSTHFLNDLKTNVPDVWQKISDFRREMVHVYFPMLLDEGIREGHFKSDINKGVAVLIMVNAMEIIINPQNTETLPPDLLKDIPQKPEKLFDNVIQIIYDGIHEGKSGF